MKASREQSGLKAKNTFPPHEFIRSPHGYYDTNITIIKHPSSQKNRGFIICLLWLVRPLTHYTAFLSTDPVNTKDLLSILSASLWMSQ